MSAKRLLGWGYATQGQEDWDDEDEKLLLGLALLVEENSFRKDIAILGRALFTLPPKQEALEALARLDALLCEPDEIESRSRYDYHSPTR